MRPPVESEGRAAAASPFSQCPFKARQASSSQTSDDDGRLTRFSKMAIAIRPTTELRHRSPPAHNSLFGCAIERAGDAKLRVSTPALMMRVGGLRHRVTFVAPRFWPQPVLVYFGYFFCHPKTPPPRPPL